MSVILRFGPSSIVGGTGHRCQERTQHRVVHEFVDYPGRLVQLGWVRRNRRRGQGQQAVSYMRREVDFSRAVGKYVGIHELLPKRTELLVTLDGRGCLLAQKIAIRGSVALGIHREFECLETVVL